MEDALGAALRERARPTSPRIAGRRDGASLISLRVRPLSASVSAESARECVTSAHRGGGTCWVACAGTRSYKNELMAERWAAWSRCLIALMTMRPCHACAWVFHDRRFATMFVQMLMWRFADGRARLRFTTAHARAKRRLVAAWLDTHPVAHSPHHRFSVYPGLRCA